MLQQNWFKLINLQNAVRNVVRVRNIICFATYHLLWARDMWQPFDMINMMKFETEKGGGLYELYREETGKLVMAKGGKMGYFADIKVPLLELRSHRLPFCTGSSRHACRAALAALLMLTGRWHCSAQGEAKQLRFSRTMLLTARADTSHADAQTDLLGS